MTWPTAATKVHMDAGTDDPKQARSELADLVDQFNTLRSHFSSFMQTFVSRTTAAAARGDIDAQQLINSMTEETSPATGDFFGMYDSSAGVHRKIQFANALNVVNGLSELTSVDGANDFLSIYDASAGTTKKVKPNNLGGVFTDSFTSAEQTITSGGTISLSHGLAGIPHLVQCRLICKTAELGYSVNDQLVIDNNAQNSAGNSENKGHSVVAGNTSISIRYGSEGYHVIRKDTGNSGDITEGNWRLVVRAWR